MSIEAGTIVESDPSFQRNVFLSGEGDRWYERNLARLGSGESDPVIAALSSVGIQPRRVLEIGCANGWRLHLLHQRFGAVCVGIDPSGKAVADGSARFPALDLRVGTADKLPGLPGEYDVVIFGFCFYLIDPALHFACVAEADRVLCDGGFLVILDFLVPAPYHNPYAHREGLRTWKYEFSRYFLAHPAYSLVYRMVDAASGGLSDVDKRQAVDVLCKSVGNAFPSNPFVK